MAALTHRARSRAAWLLTQRQHGVVAWRQLEVLGFSTSAIKHRFRTGRLRPIHRGGYSVGRPELSREGRWMAAVLACGDGAFLTHLSAGALFGVCRERPGRIEVGVRVAHPVGPPDLRVGLPLPLTKEIVNGFEVDFFWPELKFVVETDGLRYHRTPSTQAKDARRDQAHTAAGFTRLRFSHHQVTHERDYVRRILGETASRLGLRIP